MNSRIAGFLIAATLVITPIAAATEASAQAPAHSTAPYVTVKRGDTLGGIAHAHHTTWQQLAAVNHLTNPNHIYPGERILLSRPPKAPSKPKPPAKPASTLNSRVLHYGEALRGTRYVWGGTSPAHGFDCSGFTQYTYKRAGKGISRVASDQYHRSVHEKAPKPGDLVFVHDKHGSVYHVAIYVNSRTWLEAEKPGKGVNYYKPWSKSVYYGHY